MELEEHLGAEAEELVRARREELKYGVPAPAEMSKCARRLFAEADLAPPGPGRSGTPPVPMGHPRGARPGC